jgi:hypothetical protein
VLTLLLHRALSQADVPDHVVSLEAKRLMTLSMHLLATALHGALSQWNSPLRVLSLEAMRRRSSMKSLGHLRRKGRRSSMTSSRGMIAIA